MAASDTELRSGVCPQCGLRVPIVNFTERPWVGGYLGRHTRPGTRAGSKCRGSFNGWVKDSLRPPSNKESRS